MKMWLKTTVRSSSVLYGIGGRLREDQQFERRVVRKGDDCVIEGFPRSANTFATYAFRSAQPAEFLVGNHTHAPAQVVRASRFGIPCMVLIRDPRAAIESYLVYTEGRVSVSDSIALWMKFYETAWDYKSNCTFATFEEVTTCFSHSIARLNTQTGSSFGIYENSEIADELVMAKIERARLERIEQGFDATSSVHKRTTPSAEKRALKERYGVELRSQENTAELNAASSLFERIVTSVIA